MRRLTAREREVLALLEKGLSPSEIASRLFIAYPTARNHIGSILRKLGARSMHEAVAIHRAHPLTDQVLAVIRDSGLPVQEDALRELFSCGHSCTVHAPVSASTPHLPVQRSQTARSRP